MKNFAFSVYTLKLPKIQKKHHEGHCQRDYKCQHKSYSKYYSRTHVLVCQKKHRNTLSGNKIRYRKRLDAKTDALKYQSQFGGIYCNSFTPANCSVTTIITF